MSDEPAWRTLTRFHGQVELLPTHLFSSWVCCSQRNPWLVLPTPEGNTSEDCPHCGYQFRLRRHQTPEDSALAAMSIEGRKGAVG